MKRQDLKMKYSSSQRENLRGRRIADISCDLSVQASKMPSS